jgi:transposase
MMSGSRTGFIHRPPICPAKPQPDWATVHRELRRPGVTLMLLWEEYCDTTSDGFSYSWFCELYKEWAGRLKLQR